MLKERTLPLVFEPRQIPCIVEPPKMNLSQIAYKRDIYPYLGHEVHCIFCLRINKYQQEGVITREHLVPREAKLMYPESLSDVVGSRWNHIRICSTSHHVIDAGEPGDGKSGVGGKIHTLRNYGLPGLMEFLAQYPRAIDPVYFGRQKQQFVNLFGFIAERLELQIAFSQKELENQKDLYNPKIVSRDPLVTVPHPNRVIEECYQATEIINFYMKEWKNGNFAIKLLKAS